MCDIPKVVLKHIFIICVVSNRTSRNVTSNPKYCAHKLANGWTALSQQLVVSAHIVAVVSFLIFAMSKMIFLLRSKRVTACVFLPPMISHQIRLSSFNLGINLLLKIILLTALKSNSINKMELSFFKSMFPGYFSNITDTRLSHIFKGCPFLIARFTMWHFIKSSSSSEMCPLQCTKCNRE